MRPIIKYTIDINVSQGLNFSVYHGIVFTPEEVRHCYEAYLKAFPFLKECGDNNKKESISFSNNIRNAIKIITRK